MAFLEVRNVRLTGIAACVPKTVEENDVIYSKWGGYENFVNTTGIERRRVSNSDICSSDLCLQAAETLITGLGWKKDTIDALIFVTQTPDYVLPATSPILQQRLGLCNSCYTLDISLGCSGWVYAMSVASLLLQGGLMKRCLLLAGDTISKFCSKEDKSTYPLFGDAGTVTALEYDVNCNPIQFSFNTDGSGYKSIIINDGGYRNLVSNESFVAKEYGESIIRNNLSLILDGMSVFSFGISKAPKSVNSLIEQFNINKEEVDYFIFHQANLFMNEKIRKKLNIETEKVPYSLKDFGNTSCSSIPLSMVTQIKEQLESKYLKFIGCGFGVGLSWGSIYFETDSIVCPPLIEL